MNHIFNTVELLKLSHSWLLFTFARSGSSLPGSFYSTSCGKLVHFFKEHWVSTQLHLLD